MRLKLCEAHNAIFKRPSSVAMYKHAQRMTSRFQIMSDSDSSGVVQQSLECSHMH